MNRNSFTVGQRVRVSDLRSSAKNCAIIASYNLDGTYDIIYDLRSTSSREQSDEEHSVQHSRIAALLPFELSDMSDQSPWQRKDNGNILFKLNDYNAAILMYKSALNSLLMNRKKVR